MYLVGKIIEKCEYHSAGDWKPGSSGGRTIKIQQSDYSICGKRRLMDEILELQDAGLVKVTVWVVYGSDAGEVAFRLENLQEFYRIAREDAQEQGQRFLSKAELVADCRRQIMDELERGVRKDWIRKYYLWLLEKLDGIGSGKVPKDFAKMDSYVKCFRELDRIETPTYKRVFSKQSLGNSKLFESKETGLEKHIISVAKTFCSDVEPDMDDAAVLEQIYIKGYAQEMALKGPLKLNIFRKGEWHTANVGDFVYGTVLNTETLQHAEIDAESLNIRKIVTVENKANFVSMPYEKDTLYIFSHGYFSPLERNFLQKLENVLEGTSVMLSTVEGTSDQSEKATCGEVEYFHSGDLDYGGVKIFEYIRKHIFPKVQPMMMDAETFFKYESYAEPIGEETLKKLKETKVEGMQELIDLLVKTGKGIEQESFLVS